MGDLSIIEDGALLITDGIIREVGVTRRVERLAEARGAQIIDATGKVVMPGFVDCSTNLLQASRKGSHSLTSSRLALQTKERLSWFIRHGTTTLEAKATNLQETRLLAAFDERPLDVVTTLLATKSSFPDFSIARSKHRMVSVSYGEDGASPEEARQYLAEARKAGFSTRILGGESVALALQMGAVAIDQPELTMNTLPLLEDSPTITTFLPGSSFRTGQHYGFARELIDKKGAVALATAFSFTESPTVSMSMVISLACTQMRMTPAESITAATINSAYALRLASVVGSLEVNKQADLIMLRISDYRDLPEHFGVNLVVMTMKRGQVLYREAKVEWPD